MAKGTYKIQGWINGHWQDCTYDLPIEGALPNMYRVLNPHGNIVSVSDYDTCLETCQRLRRATSPSQSMFR